MEPPALIEIEGQISRLSRPEQLLLIERLIRRLRMDASSMPLSAEDDLTAMAADPDIRREIREIDEEFACTEMDGLEDD
jgi:hypothetical protein